MYKVSDQTFKELIEDCLKELPKDHVNAIKNVAIIFEDEPNLMQREKLNLKPYETLFGLYEGTPISARQGNQKIIPDKITLFKLPIESVSSDLKSLKEQLKHTLWHEIAHYFGLNHDDIRKLDKR